MKSRRFNWLAAGSMAVAACLAGMRTAVAALSLAAPFSDHMVLQREVPLRVFGHAGSGVSVSVMLAGQSASTKTESDGSWTVEFKPISPGGPHQLIVKSGDESVTLSDVLIGDVWLCSGQSNMQFKLADSVGGKELAANATKSGELRLLMIPKAPAGEPADRFDAKWTPAEPGPAGEFTAVGMFFAEALRKHEPSLKTVPIGLIDSSFGGTRVEGWIPQTVLSKQFKPADLHESMFGIKPAHLYNGMIAPLAGLNVKGVLWYQGESNTAQAALYPSLMKAMFTQWRSDFRDPALPFYLVQLANYPEPWEGYSFAWLRDAQAKAAAADPQAALAVAIDTPDGYDLHPRYKAQLGDRLARLALKKTYGNQIISQGPTFASAKPEGDAMRVTFDVGASPLFLRPADSTGFELAGTDGRFFAATLTKAGASTLLVRSDEVKSPAFVRYAFRADPDVTIFNEAGLPAAPFRTDSQPETPMAEIQRTRPARRIITPLYIARVEPDGRLASVMVNGQEQLSTDDGGGFMPMSVWGARKLFAATDESARTVRFTDGGCEVRYEFQDDCIRITITNNADKDAVATRCLLSPLSQEASAPAAAAKGGEKTITFQRDRSGLTLEGADETEHVFGVVWQAKLGIPAKSSRTLVLRPVSPPK